MVTLLGIVLGCMDLLCTTLGHLFVDSGGDSGAGNYFLNLVSCRGGVVATDLVQHHLRIGIINGECAQLTQSGALPRLLTAP